MDTDRNVFRKRVIIFSVISIFLSGYLAGLLQFVRVNHYATWNPFSILTCIVRNGMPVGFFLLFLVCFGVILLIMVNYHIQRTQGYDVMGRAFRMSQDRQSYGEAHFEDPSEYQLKATIEPPEKAMGQIFGQLDRDGKKLITQRMDSENRGNRNIAVIGASGSGKTYTLVKSSCLQIVRRRESVVITDPDGGLFRDMSTYFEDNGYVVRHLDLNDLKRSDGWHCLRSISCETPEIDSQLFAQTAISNASNDIRDIHASGSLALLRALILRVILDPDIPEEDKNITNVYSLLQLPGGEADLDVRFDSTIMPECMKPCVLPYRSFKQGSPNIRGNIILNLSIYLQLLQNESVSTLLSTDDIDLELPGKQPCAYFCGFPDSHETYRFIVSLFFSMIFIRLINLSDNVLHAPLPVPVNFLLDEFPSIGHLPDWAPKMSTIRKRNITATLIFQDIAQLTNVYEREWGTILGNCATMVILGINEDKSAELVTKRIGDTTIEAQTTQASGMELFFSKFYAKDKKSTEEGRRALMAYDELFKLDQDREIILFQGHNPILCWKYPHVLHPEAKYLRKVDYDSIPILTDTVGRQKRRAEEEKRLAEYYQEHPLEKIQRDYSYCYTEEEEEQNHVKGFFRRLILALADKLDPMEEENYANNEKTETETMEEAEETDPSNDQDPLPWLDGGTIESVWSDNLFGDQHEIPILISSDEESAEIGWNDVHSTTGEKRSLKSPANEYSLESRENELGGSLCAREEDRAENQQNSCGGQEKGETSKEFTPSLNRLKAKAERQSLEMKRQLGLEQPNMFKLNRDVETGAEVKQTYRPKKRQAQDR